MRYRHTRMKGCCDMHVGTDSYGDPCLYELVVYFDAERGYDLHPYGSTYARQDWLEIGEATDYELDGNPITWRELDARFGKTRIDAAIEECADNAEEE